jgi:hypothetical protein
MHPKQLSSYPGKGGKPPIIEKTCSTGNGWDKEVLKK